MPNDLTLKLTPALLRQITAYARQRRLSREDAALELILRGLDGEEGALVTPEGPPLNPLSARLKEIFEEGEGDPLRRLLESRRPEPKWRRSKGRRR